MRRRSGQIESYKAAKIKAKLIVIIAKLTTFISG